MESHNVAETDAPSSLDALAATRAQVADRLITPPWYHPILGVILAVIVVSPNLPRPWNTVVVGLAAAGIGLLIQAYRRLTGVWVGGFSVPGTRRWAILLLVVAMGCFLTSLIAADGHHLGVAVSAAAIAGAAVMLIGPRFDAAIRATFRDGR